jgi:N-acetylglucosaminyldiphosphoundecaprenol N-acetyl-beta-D-mannosaminyltransferase
LPVNVKRRSVGAGFGASPLTSVARLLASSRNADQCRAPVDAAPPLPPPPPRFNVLGVGVHALTLATARDLVLAAHGRQRLGYVCLGTAYGIVDAQDDPALRAIYNHSYLTTPDGMPLVWLGRQQGHRHVTRVYGPDLMLAVCDAGRTTGLTHYLYGGAPGVADELRARLAARFPGIQIVGTGTPPFRPLSDAETAAFRADVARARPDVLWIGLGTPKQERFMAAHGAALDAGVLVGVGAAFDFHSGRVRQAPRWIQRSGFEWLFRLCLEPRRLGPRYLKANPRFVAGVLAQLVGRRRYALD